MADDYRLNLDFWDHRKTRMLKKRHGDSGIVSLLRLWQSVARFYPDGVMGNLREEEIEALSDWQKKPGAFFKDIMNIGFLNRDTEGNYIVHNWQLHQPWVAGAPRRAAMARFFRFKKARPDAYEVIYATGVRHMTKEEYQALKDLPIEEIKALYPLTPIIDYSTDQEAEHDSDGVIVEDNGQAVQSANTGTANDVTPTTSHDGPPVDQLSNTLEKEGVPYLMGKGIAIDKARHELAAFQTLYGEDMVRNALVKAKNYPVQSPLDYLRKILANDADLPVYVRKKKAQPLKPDHFLNALNKSKQGDLDRHYPSLASVKNFDAIGNILPIIFNDKASSVGARNENGRK